MGYDANKYQAKAARAHPSQERGKERVRLILATALELFRERGIEATTTNDIAHRAGIPIGSLYRYYPNKEAIVAALTELYVEDISRIFTDISKHPMLPYLSWDEVLMLVVDGWINYARLNGPFALLYAVRTNPQLREQNRQVFERFFLAFMAVLKKRCPDISRRQALVCFNLCLAVVQMGTADGQDELSGRGLYHQAIGVISAYMLRNCLQHFHPTA